MDRDTVWSHTHAARRDLVEVLHGLDDAAWETDSLCAGWTVKDVAAHVTASAQVGFAQLPGLMWEGRFNVDRGIFLDGKRRGRASVPEILATYERLDGSRRHTPVTSHLEPLIDVLVHTQDIARPLGIEVAPDLEAAVVAADRARFLAPFMGGRDMLKRYRMVATDTDWERGKGAETVEAPMVELLMLCTGRPARV